MVYLPFRIRYSGSFLDSLAYLSLWFLLRLLDILVPQSIKFA